MAPILMIPEKSICVVRNVTSRHLNLFGFIHQTPHPGTHNFMTSWPLPGEVSLRIGTVLVYSLHKRYTPGTNITMEKQQFEDVFPTN